MVEGGKQSMERIERESLDGVEGAEGADAWIEFGRIHYLLTCL